MCVEESEFRANRGHARQGRKVDVKRDRRGPSSRETGTHAAEASLLVYVLRVKVKGCRLERYFFERSFVIQRKLTNSKSCEVKRMILTSI